MTWHYCYTNVKFRVRSLNHHRGPLLIFPVIPLVTDPAIRAVASIFPTQQKHVRHERFSSMGGRTEKIKKKGAAATVGRNWYAWNDPLATAVTGPCVTTPQLEGLTPADGRAW